MTEANRSAEQRVYSDGAVLSSDERYRYKLQRTWNAAPIHRGPVLWVMLNPSTADAATDDPTIRRCKSFTDSWGYGSMLVGNLYALRATDPAELAKSANPVGDLNWAYLQDMAGDAAIIVAAWGAHKMATRTATAHTFDLLRGAVFCLGRSKSGAPRHPLYVGGLQPLLPWRPL